MNKIKLLTIILVIAAQILPAQGLIFSPEAADLYQNGIQALRMRRLTIARQEFKELMEKYPDDVHTAMARRQMALVLRDLKEYDAAITLLQEILQKDISADNQRFAREETLSILLELHRYKQGVDLIEEWRKTSPDDIALSRQLAKFYLQTGRKDEAWLLLESILERHAAPDAFKDLLDLAMRSDEINKLLQTLESRRARYRSNDYADYVSDCYLALNKKDKAIEALRDVDNLANYLNLQRKLADLLMAAGEYDEAFECLSMSLKIVPVDWNTIRKMGHCRFMQKKVDEAIAIWRQPLGLPYVQRREFYQDFTTVLIEHQLYEESLTAFQEARTVLQQNTLFSEEVASVLEALGRNEEALEEFVKVFIEGIYRSEVFERLYKATEKGFDFEKRLVQLQKTGFNTAVLQALLEIYFRQADLGKVQKIIDIVSSAAGALDELFYERLNQEALLSPAEFHYALAEKAIKERSASTLALRLAKLLLEMGSLDDAWLQKAFTDAAMVVKNKSVADAVLKSELLLELAKYALQHLHDIKKAQGFVDEILQTELLKASPGNGLAAGILQARLLILQEKYGPAADLLRESERIIGQANADIFTNDPIAESDYLAQIILEKARLAAHSGEYQKALEELKGLVENLPESEWVNDALEMANFIMRRSIGDLSMIQRALKAERLQYRQKYSEAIAELEGAINSNASATALIEETQADILVLQKHTEESSKLISLIDAYAHKNPTSYKTADLAELKWRLMKKQSAPDSEIREHLQTFLDMFPSDLRSGRFKKILATKAKKINGVTGEAK